MNWLAFFAVLIGAPLVIFVLSPPGVSMAVVFWSRLSEVARRRIALFVEVVLCLVAICALVGLATLVGLNYTEWS